MDEVVKGLLLKRSGILEPPTGEPVTALQRILRGRAANLTTREVESLRPTPRRSSFFRSEAQSSLRFPRP